MCMPYACVPTIYLSLQTSDSFIHSLSCGHMACQTCLVNWFTSTKNDQNVDTENPGIEWYSDEESDIEADGPNSEAGPVTNGIHADVANGHANANQDVDNNGNVHQPGPAAAPVPNALKRRKTCPHCRCIIKQRPIQIYPVKDIVGILVPGVDQESQTSSKKDPKDTTVIDPWQGIFPVVPPPPGPDHGPGPGPGPGDSDDDDDGPWPGFGGMVHPAPPLPQDDPEPDPDDFVPIGDLMPQAHPPPPFAPPPFIDEEDGVRRCGMCLHELWGGMCTNDACNTHYGDASEESDDGVDIIQSDGFFYGDGENERGQPEAQQSDAIDGDVEDGYESSFIDDGDDHEGIFHRLRRKFWPRIREATSSDVDLASPEVKVTSSSTSEDDFVPGPSRRYSGGRDPIHISSSEEDVQLPCRVRHGRTQRIIDVDEEDAEQEEEQEVEGDVRSTDERYEKILLLNVTLDHTCFVIFQGHSQKRSRL